jgi:histone H1/5
MLGLILLQMVKEAIGSLKERTGSSQYAIAKYLEDTYKTNLPPNFKKTLSIQLRNLTKQGKIYKVKNSFKLSDELKKPTKAPKPVASITEVKDSEAPKATKVAKKPAGRLKKTLSGTSVPKSPSQTAAAAKPAKAPKSVKASKAETKPAKATKTAGKRKAPAAATTKKVEEKTASPVRKPAAVRKTAPKKVVTPKKSPKSVKAAKPKTVKAAKTGKTSKATAASPAKKAKK